MIGRKYNMTRKIKILSANKYTFHDLNFSKVTDGLWVPWILGLLYSADQQAGLAPVLTPVLTKLLGINS